MPSLLCHWFFAQDVLASPYCPEAIRKYPALLTLGAQGPDPFFFWSRVPWKKRSSPGEETPGNFGNRLHDNWAQDYFEPFLALLSDKADFLSTLERDYAMAFVYGLFLHYLLDRSAHPYVYAFTGFNAEGKTTPPWILQHMQFETYADIAFAQHRGWPIKQLKAWKLLDAPAEQVQILSRLFKTAFREALDENTYFDAWQDMRKIRRILHDPQGFKAWIFRLLGQKNTQVAASIHPVKLKAQEIKFYLNLEHKSWPDPRNGELKTDSFPDRFSKALGDLPSLKELFDQVLTKTYRPEAWKDFYKGLNHEGHGQGEIKRYSLALEPDAYGKLLPKI